MTEVMESSKWATDKQQYKTNTQICQHAQDTELETNDANQTFKTDSSQHTRTGELIYI